MKKSLLALSFFATSFFATFLVVSKAYSQEDAPFDDLESELNQSKGADKALPKEAPGQESSATAQKKETPPEESALPKEEGVRDVLTPAPGKTADEDNLDDLEKDLAAPESPPKVVEEEKTPAPEVKKAAVPPPPPPPENVPTPLLSSGPDAEVLDPSDQFERVPLRPQMSDANWKKWAGPGLEKIYRIRRKDTLWAISERLFGNPYLWPKVWQLNAQFGNPHFIDPGIELQFVPGNPNSAPSLAIRSSNSGEFETVGYVEGSDKIGMLESLETILRLQRISSNPPFQNFAISTLPETIGQIPKKFPGERIYYTEGELFPLTGVPEGRYSIVKIVGINKTSSFKTPFKAQRLQWLGVLDVTGNVAKVLQAFNEISAGDLIVRDDFTVPPLSLREEAVDPTEAGRAKMAPIQEGFLSGAAPYTVMGVEFSSPTAGPQVGVVVNLANYFRDFGKGLVVHRDGRLATMWVFEAEREVTPKDHLR